MDMEERDIIDEQVLPAWDALTLEVNTDDGTYFASIEALDAEGQIRWGKQQMWEVHFTAGASYTINGLCGADFWGVVDTEAEGKQWCERIIAHLMADS